jgi:hypothetical protein
MAQALPEKSLALTDAFLKMRKARPRLLVLFQQPPAL